LKILGSAASTILDVKLNFVLALSSCVRSSTAIVRAPEAVHAVDYADVQSGCRASGGDVADNDGPRLVEATGEAGDGLAEAGAARENANISLHSYS
jgi:hypothetical protein